MTYQRVMIDAARSWHFYRLKAVRTVKTEGELENSSSSAKFWA